MRPRRRASEGKGRLLHSAKTPCFPTVSAAGKETPTADETDGTSKCGERVMWTFTGNFKPLDSEVPKSELAAGTKPRGDPETRALAPEPATEINIRSVWSGAGTHTAQFSTARRRCPVAPASSPPPKTRSPGKNSRTQAFRARFPALTLAFCWGECPPAQGPPVYPWLAFLD